MKRRLLLSTGALSITAMPLVTLISCGSEPTKLNATIPERKTFEFSKDITLTDETTKSLASSLEEFNTELQRQIDERTSEYFFAIADVVAKTTNDQLDDIKAVRKILEIFYDYVFRFATINLTIKLSFAGHETETITQSIDLIDELEMENQILENINVENVTGLLSLFKHNLIRLDNFKEDQYELLKKSVIITDYATQLGTTELLIYDFNALKNDITLPSYEIYWSTSAVEADRILEKLTSNFRIY